MMMTLMMSVEHRSWSSDDDEKMLITIGMANDGVESDDDVH